jgi:hypothetical protein
VAGWDREALFSVSGGWTLGTEIGAMSDGDGPSTLLLFWFHSSHTNAQAQLQRTVFLQILVLVSRAMLSLGLVIKKDIDISVQRMSMATCEHKEDGRGYRAHWASRTHTMERLMSCPRYVWDQQAQSTALQCHA